MARPIDAFRANFKTYNKASHFACDIQGPIPSPLGAATEYYITSANMPGRNMVTSDVKYGVNLPEKKVYSSAYSPCTITFLCDGSMSLYRWFQDWQDLMQDPLTGRVEWSDNYVGTVSVRSFDTLGLATHTHILQAAFPENLSDISYDYGSEDIARFDVTFAYRHYSNSPGTLGADLLDNIVTTAFGGLALNASIGPVRISI